MINRFAAQVDQSLPVFIVLAGLNLEGEVQMIGSPPAVQSNSASLPQPQRRPVFEYNRHRGAIGPARHPGVGEKSRVERLGPVEIADLDMDFNDTHNRKTGRRNTRFQIICRARGSVIDVLAQNGVHPLRHFRVRQHFCRAGNLSGLHLIGQHVRRIADDRYLGGCAVGAKLVNQ